jgi:hypothetical protein
MMKKRFLLLFVSGLLLTSCATTEVLDTWKDDSQTEKFSTIFVLAVIKEPAYRNLLENKLVNVLKDTGVTAYPTHLFFPQADQIDEAAAAAAIKEKGVDGVMVVRLVDTKNETVYTPGTTYIEDGYGGRYSRGWYGYYGRGYRVVSTPGYTTQYNISTVESAIFNTDTKKRVWSTITQTSETSVPSAINSYIKAIGNPLKSSGLF